MITITRLNKTFKAGKGLKNINLDIASGEMVAVIGASGSGKSTLMRHISGLMLGDRADGLVEVQSRVMQRGGRLSTNARAVRAEVGVIFQRCNLVDRFSVMSNVLMGALSRVPTWRAVANRYPRTERRLAMDALARVGMDGKAWRRASTLSGGEQQRVAIARALTQRARVLLADEPIASLDPEAARVVMGLLAQIHRQEKLTVLVSLHQVEYAIRYCSRTIALRQGEVVHDGPSAELTPAFLRDIYGAESADLFTPVFGHSMGESRLSALSGLNSVAPAAA